MLFLFLRSLTVSGKSQGVDSNSGACFRQARRSGRWPAAAAVHRRAVTQARAKLPWTACEQLHRDAGCLTDALWPAADEDTGQGLSVFAIDGASYPLPAAAGLRQAVDPDRGRDPPGKGH
jgi:hypothetical protein